MLKMGRMNKKNKSQLVIPVIPIPNVSRSP